IAVFFDDLCSHLLQALDVIIYRTWANAISSWHGDHSLAATMQQWSDRHHTDAVQSTHGTRNMAIRNLSGLDSQAMRLTIHLYIRTQVLTQLYREFHIS